MPDMPEWCHVWFWMRFVRDPQDMRSLPQQDGFVGEMMSRAEYAEVRIEWLNAGALRTSPAQVVEAMSGGRTWADVEVPF